ISEEKIDFSMELAGGNVLDTVTVLPQFQADFLGSQNGFIYQRQVDTWRNARPGGHGIGHARGAVAFQQGAGFAVGNAIVPWDPGVGFGESLLSVDAKTIDALLSFSDYLIVVAHEPNSGVEFAEVVGLAVP